MRHRVSVVITTFNKAPYISGAVEAALRQTFRSREILVVDDGSDDTTGEVLEPIEEVVIDLAPNQTSWPYVAMTMRLMDEFGVTLIEDEPYRELYYDGEPPPAPLTTMAIGRRACGEPASERSSTTAGCASPRAVTGAVVVTLFGAGALRSSAWPYARGWNG